MSKVLKIAAVVVGVVAITVATAGIGTAPAIAGAAATASTAAVAGSAAVGASLFGISAGTLTAIGAGLSVASGLLAKKPSSGSAVGSPTNWKADVGAPLPYWIGRTLNAGSLAHRVAYPGLTPQIENQMQGFVTIYSAAGPIAGFDTYLVDKVVTTFAGSPPTAVGSYANWMWLTAQLGNQPEAAAHVPPRTTMPGWTSASKLSGLASTMFTIGFDSSGKKWTSGEPKLAVVGRGVRVYDPRADSTYPGGSGAQRAANEATWAYSDNPWLHALTWAIGRRSNGIRTLGVGMPIASIDVDAFVQAANVADANGWKIGGVVGSTDDKWNVLKQMCQAGGGEPVRQAAMLSCFVNTPKVSLATITADDLADGDISFPAMQPRRARINSVVPTYRSEDHDWEVVAGDVVKGATYITEDGETRTRQVDYPLVQCFAGQQPVQAAQLAAYDIVNAREYGPIPLPLKPAWIRFKNGDCLTLNIPDANLVNQTAIILKRGLDPSNGAVSLTFRSETPAKHAFALGKTTTAPPTPSISAPPVNPYWSDPNATRNDDGENFILNPQLTDNIEPWVLSAGVFRQAISGFPLAAWFQFPVGTNLNAIANSNEIIPLNGATTLHVSSLRYSASATGAMTAIIDFYDAAGAYTGYSYVLDLFAGASAAFTPVRGFTTNALWPANATHYGVHYTSNLTGGVFNAGALRVARTQDAADVTLIATGPASASIARDYTGTPKAGELPRDFGFKMTAGAANVTSLTSWSAAVKAGQPSSTFTPTPGSPNNTGALNVTAASDGAVIIMTGTYQGVSRSVELTLASAKDPPPSGGSSGSGSSASTSTIAPTSSTSYGAANTGILTATAGTSGRVDLAYPGGFQRTTNGSSNAAGKWQWRVVGGTFADVAGEINSITSADKGGASGGDPAYSYAGQIYVTMAQTGLTNGTAYQFQLLLRNTSAGTCNWTGTASAVGS